MTLVDIYNWIYKLYQKLFWLRCDPPYKIKKEIHNRLSGGNLYNRSIYLDGNYFRYRAKPEGDTQRVSLSPESRQFKLGQRWTQIGYYRKLKWGK
jgi:hypothetical protein